MRVQAIIASTLLIVIAPLLVSGPSTSAPEANEALLVGGTIVDPLTRTTVASNVHIRGQDIVDIVDGIPTGFSGEMIDVSGKWITPGFVDTHVHAYGDPSPTYMANSYGILGVAKRQLFAGVTAMLDLYNFEDDILTIRDAQAKQSILAADILASGPCFTATGGHCSEYGMTTRMVDTPEEARREVLDLIATAHPDVIKLVYDHNYTRLPTLTRETMAALVGAASESGTRTVVHIGTWQDALEAVEAGATAITHTYWQDVPSELTSLMVERGTFFIPTLVVQADMMHFVDTPELLDDPLLRSMKHDALLTDYRDNASFSTRATGTIDFQRRGAGYYERQVQAMHAAGVTILTGTDAGNLGVFHGYSLHREMELLVAAGLTPWDALRAATVDAGRFLGRRYGIAPGDVANLVILDASPVDDIRNTKTIWNVIHRGRLVDRTTLLRTVHR